MTDEDLMARIESANDKFVTGETVANEPPTPVDKISPANSKITSESVQEWLPIDLYRNNQRKLVAEKRKEHPKGSRAIIKYVTETMVNGGDGSEGLARAKKRAEGDIDILKAQGYKDRAEIRKQQYMEEKFLPAVEIVIEYTSPDELLNCKEALNALDSMALGSGAMRGYTASYVRQAYGNVLGQTRGGSDPSVVAEMRRIRALVDNDQIRTAIGMATKLKKKIDDGDAMAEPEDYAVLGRIVAYAN